MQIDSTPPAAALPALQRVAASLSGKETKGAAGGFGNLLALLTGHHDGGGKAHPPAAGSLGAPGTGTTVPFGLTRAATVSKTAGTAKDDAGTFADATAAVPEIDAHAADEKALADNLTWLLALAAAPKTPTQLPAAGGGFGGPAADGSSCAAAYGSSCAAASDALAAAFEQASAGSGIGRGTEGPTARDAFRAQAKAGPHGHGPTSSSVGSGFSRTFAAAGAPAAVDKTFAAAATIAAALDATDDAADSGPVPEAGTPQFAPRAVAGDAASASDVAKKAAAPPVASPIFVPIAAAESRSGDDRNATKRDGRGPDDRFAEASLPKTGALAPAINPAFQLPAEMRAQPGHQLLAAEGAAPARADVSVDGDVPRQIVQAIRMQWADGVGTARITLQPEYLGELSIAIRVDHGAVTASLESNTASVREWIDGNQTMLRQSLAEHGLHLDKLTVAEEQPQPDWSGNDEPKQKQQEEEARRAQRARRRNDADAPAFEMVA